MQGWAAFRAYLCYPSVCSASTYYKYAYAAQTSECLGMHRNSAQPGSEFQESPTRYAFAAQTSECLGMHRNSAQPRVTGYTVIR